MSDWKQLAIKTWTQNSNNVKQYGEVYTPDSIVNSMLDLVDENNDKDYISTTYLEPTCGDGQFLIRILYRKLLKVKELPIEQRPLALIKAVASIYGVEIQSDKVDIARARMYRMIIGLEVNTFDINKDNIQISVDIGIDFTKQDKLLDSITYILEHNIICGNMLDKDSNESLFEYKFTGEQVELTECSLADLSLEIDKKGPVHYLELTSLIQSDNDDDDIGYDF